MSRIWFSRELEAVAVFWRVFRQDGITHGFTTHDRDIWLDGVLHASAPGMIPSAIRRSAGFEADSAEIEGSLSHDSISASDLASGRFDNARITVGLVDWETGESQVLFRGAIGAVSRVDEGFTAELQSRKAELAIDRVPRTSPACRAVFCGKGCGLSAARFSHQGIVIVSDHASNTVTLETPVALGNLVGGTLTWLDGPLAGIGMAVIGVTGDAVRVDSALVDGLLAGMRVELREGCDRTISTCATRFGNGVNFQGEPYLPGNDLITRYPIPDQ